MQSELTNWWSQIISWLETSGPKVLAVIIVAVVVSWVVSIILRRTVKRAVMRNSRLSEIERTQRIDTLQRVTGGTTKVVVGILALMTLLSVVGVSIGPLLATAGVAGVALGFGAQYLINDVITGFFILTENQFSVGDVVCLNDTCGVVEAVSLRRAKLRDLSGVVHYVPNSEIKIASNMSQHFSRVNLDVGISYDADVDAVIEVINTVGQELAEDDGWKDKIREAPQFLRVDEFGDSAIYLKVLGDVEPAEQWAVSGELRRRLKQAFDDQAIEIPLPQRVIHKPQKK